MDADVTKAASHVVEGLIANHGWRHGLGENELTAQEMGSSTAMLPLLAWIASNSVEAGLDVPLNLELAVNEDALLGVDLVDVSGPPPSAIVLFVSDALHTINEAASSGNTYAPTVTRLDTAVAAFLDEMGKGKFAHITLPRRVAAFAFNRASPS